MNIHTDAEQQSTQPGTALYMITCIFLILVVIGTAVPYCILNALGIIDVPAAVALPLFRQQSTTIILAYYSLAFNFTQITTISFVPDMDWMVWHFCCHLSIH